MQCESNMQSSTQIIASNFTYCEVCKNWKNPKQNSRKKEKNWKFDFILTYLQLSHDNSNLLRGMFIRFADIHKKDSK